MKKLIFFILCLCIFLSCSTTHKAKRKLASEISKPRNIIFLVHGITADEKTFGFMGEALTSALSYETDYQYIVRNFVYETRNNQNTTEQFARDLGKTIHQFFEENGAINSQDKISIIAHSQGGLISLIWLYRSMLKDKDFHPEYVKYVDSYITLGTPFWGAKIAVMGDTIKKMAKKFDENAIPYFGNKQLEDMSFGSETIFNFRRNAINPKFQNMMEKLSEQIHPINFGGAASSMVLLTPFASGKRQYEDDSAVPLPSSRFDFIYASSIKDNYDSREILRFKEFNETHFSEHHVVDALHVSLMPSVLMWSALADIPEECVKNSECNHPTFKYITAALKHTDLTPNETLQSKMTAYLIDLNIKLPDGDTLPAEKIKISFLSEDKNLNTANPMEFYSHGYNANFGNESYRHFYFTGTADKSFIPKELRGAGPSFKDKQLLIEVKARGYKTRRIEAKVRATYSTYIEINLEKIKDTLSN